MEKPPIRDVVEYYGGEVFARGRSRCPFHEDRHPSASIKEDGDFFSCFVCDIKTDSLGLIMKGEGCGFREAVKLAAERFGTSDSEVRGSSSGVPSYLVSGGKGNSKGSRKYIPAWLRRDSGEGS